MNNPMQMSALYTCFFFMAQNPSKLLGICQPSLRNSFVNARGVRWQEGRAAGKCFSPAAQDVGKEASGYCKLLADDCSFSGTISYPG